MKTRRLPPLNSLKAFEAAGRHESFLEAATEQNVTSGSISRHVRLLERFLGTELFVRRSNGVTLTSAGREYAAKVGGIFRDLRTATDRVRKPRDRTIAISTLPIFAERWLYRRIPSFRKAFDGVELRIEAHNGEHDTEREGRGCVDPVFERTPSRLQRHAAVSERRSFRSAARNSERRCQTTPVPTRSSGQPLLHDIYWDTDWPDWARAVDATPGELAANMRFCALQGRHPGGGRRHGHGRRTWRDGGPRSLRPESLFPCRTSRSLPRSRITWS